MSLNCQSINILKISKKQSIIPCVKKMNLGKFNDTNQG